MRAVFNGEVIAESDDTIVIEGNHYFPADSVKAEFLTATPYTTRCPWKGEASYYDVSAGGETATNAAWYYPAPLEKATMIKDHIAFFPIVGVTE